jgi:long-chain fatty acid transport protein
MPRMRPQPISTYVKHSVFALALALLPQSGWALGTRVVDQNAEATARGDAFAATADNPSAVYYNPAGITQLHGTQLLLGGYGITFNNRIDLKADGDPFDNKYKLQGVPQVFATIEVPKTPFTLGLGIYSPFGFSNKYADDVPFRNLATEGSIAWITVNPVIAFKITPTLSFALGPMISYAEAELVQGVRAPGDEFRFKGDDVAIGGNAGLMWQPHKMHSFGATYFSPTTMQFKGHSHLQYDAFTLPVEVFPGFTVPFPVPAADQRETATANFHFPQHVVLGYSFRPTDEWNFEVNVDWTDWDSLNTVTLKQKSGNIAIPFNWSSSFLYEFGVTKKFGDWKVSAGYVYSENSVPAGSFTPLVPDTDRHILSAGFGRKWNNFDAFVAYQYTWSGKRDISEGTLADGTYKFEAHALTLSLAYRF